MYLDDFRGEYKWLSNFGHSPIVKWSILTRDYEKYDTVEHLFQASKAVTKAEHEWVQSSKTPRIARSRGQKIRLRSDWEHVKVQVMKDAISRKFSQNDDLRQRLIDTEDRYLIEGNTWGDKFWGVCEGRGQNKLGEILMEYRANLGGKI